MALHEYMKRVVEQREVLSRSQARALLNLVLAGSTEADQPGSPHSSNSPRFSELSPREESRSRTGRLCRSHARRSNPRPAQRRRTRTPRRHLRYRGDDTGTFNISTAAACVARRGWSRRWFPNDGRQARKPRRHLQCARWLEPRFHLSHPSRRAASLRRHRFAFRTRPACIPP